MVNDSQWLFIMIIYIYISSWIRWISLCVTVVGCMILDEIYISARFNRYYEAWLYQYHYAVKTYDISIHWELTMNDQPQQVEI